MAAGIVASTLRRKAFHKRALHDSATRYQAIEPGHIGTAPSGQRLGGQGHGLLYSRTVLEDPIHGSHNGNLLLRPWLSGHIGTAPSLYQRTTPSRPRPEITVLKDSPQGRGQSSRTQSLVPTMETYYYGRGSLITNTRNVFEYNTNARDYCTVEVEDSRRGSRPGQCVVATGHIGGVQASSPTDDVPPTWRTSSIVRVESPPSASRVPTSHLSYKDFWPACLNAAETNLYQLEFETFEYVRRLCLVVALGSR